MLIRYWYHIAEWAIARLQAEASFQFEQMQSAASGAITKCSLAREPDRESVSDDAESSTQDSNPDSSARIIGRYHCTSRNRHGRLTVTNEGIDFKQHLTKDRSWQLGYKDIKAIQKVWHTKPNFLLPFPTSELIYILPDSRLQHH